MARKYCDLGYLPRYCGAFLEGLAGTLPDPARVVEIGSASGCSLQAIMVGLRLHNNYHVWTVDIRELPYLKPESKRMELPEGNWTQVTMPSMEVAKKWSEPLDMVYVDGDHQYESCQEDIYAWVDHLKFGGIMVFDDYEQFGWTVTQAVDDIMFAEDSDWRFIGQIGRLIAFEKGTKNCRSPWLTDWMVKYDSQATNVETGEPDPWLTWAWGFLYDYYHKQRPVNMSYPLSAIRRNIFEKAGFIYKTRNED